MTREEIRQEALKAEKEKFPRCAGDKENSFHGVNSAYGLGFVDGALWADEHPKSLWISVKDDLPCNYPENIHFGFTNNVIATDGTSIFILHMKKCKDNKWIWCGNNSEDDTVYSVEFSHSVTHWMPFPKPPKE